MNAEEVLEKLRQGLKDMEACRDMTPSFLWDQECIRMEDLIADIEAAYKKYNQADFVDQRKEHGVWTKWLTGCK